MPDLRVYGDSGKPPGGYNHINYSKRSMALDQVEGMEKLGSGNSHSSAMTVARVSRIGSYSITPTARCPIQQPIALALLRRLNLPHQRRAWAITPPNPTPQLFALRNSLLARSH